MLQGMGSRVAGILALAALAAMPLPAAAQTPDGQTPAQETACNGQTGAAYGLCTSVLRSDGLRHTAPAASATACNKVYSNFLRLTGQAPPCLCPCSAGWAQVSRPLRTRTWKSRNARSAATSHKCTLDPLRFASICVNYTVEGSFCTGWNNWVLPVVSVSPLTAPQISACRSIISNICSQQ